MSRLIIFEQADGRVGICAPTGEIPIEDVQARHYPTNSFIVEPSALPMADYDFSDAWRMSPQGEISVDLEAAKEVTRTRLRTERKPLLAALDIAFIKAIEFGTPTAEISAEKQRLRDITLLVDPCTTLQELRSLRCSKVEITPEPPAPPSLPN